MLITDLLAAALGIGAWGLFILYATNNGTHTWYSFWLTIERLSSSVVRQVLFQLRNTSDVADVLGEHVRFAPNWWGFGEPWISGGVSTMPVSLMTDQPDARPYRCQVPYEG